MTQTTPSIPDGWTSMDKALHRTFAFDSFAAAIAFMVEIAPFCDKTDHHPEWTNIYDRVMVTLTTHDAGDVSEKDIALAIHMNDVYAHKQKNAPVAAA